MLLGCCYHAVTDSNMNKGSYCQYNVVRIRICISVGISVGVCHRICVDFSVGVIVVISFGINAGISVGSNLNDIGRASFILISSHSLSLSKSQSSLGHSLPPNYPHSDLKICE